MSCAGALLPRGKQPVQLSLLLHLLQETPVDIFSIRSLWVCENVLPLLVTGGPMDNVTLHAHCSCWSSSGGTWKADPGGGGGRRGPEPPEGGGYVQHGGREVEEEECAAGGPDGGFHHSERLIIHF